MTHKAIREKYPAVVTIDGNNRCYDKGGNLLDLDLSVVPDYSQEEIQNRTKRDGEDYNGYQIPFMNDDALALMQVKSAFEMGVTSTNIEFTNGTVMPMNVTEFQEFAVWFVNKRNSFFT